MIEYNPGQTVKYRIGFNTYADMLSKRESWNYSEELSVELPVQQSLTGKYEYPYKFDVIEFTESGSDAGFGLSGSH